MADAKATTESADAVGTSVEPVIRLKEVRKSFEGQLVHQGVTLDIEPGEVMTLVGGSGQGKSVLLREIIGLTKPDSGEVVVKGRHVERMHESDLLKLRREVGMLFQGSALFDSLTVFENVAFPLRAHRKMKEDEIAAEVHEMLRLVELPDAAELMPAELSGGMKKRVGLARALAIKPDIMLYDEPTTGLDPTTANHINDLIKRLQQELGVTSVMVTHDMQSVKEVTDRLAMLHRGRIIAVGTWKQMEDSTVPVVRQFLEGTVEEW